MHMCIYWTDITVTENVNRFNLHDNVRLHLFLNFFSIFFPQVASIPHISREIFDMITNEKQGIQVSIETTSILEGAVSLYQKGISSFAGLDHTFSFVTLKDTGSKMLSHYSQTSVAIATRAGEMAITPKKYMTLIEAFKPDLFHTLCDGDTNEFSGNKRTYNSVKRTKSFFEDCMALYKSSTALVDSMLIGKMKFEI